MSALELLGENAPAFSDEDLALRFAGQHADDLRFVAAWNRWLVSNGKNWQFEETLRAWDFARQICRDAATQCNKRRKPAASQAQRLSMPLSAWLVPIGGSRPLSTNGMLIRGS